MVPLEAAPRIPARFHGLVQVLWWALALTAFGLIIGGIPTRYLEVQAHFQNERSLQELNIAPGSAALFFLLSNLAVVSAHNLLAWFLFRRRQDDPVALFVSFTLVSNGAILPLSLFYAGGAPFPWVRLLVDAVIYTGLVSSVVLLFIFPDGRFVPRWTRFLSVLWVVFALAFLVSAPGFPTWPRALQAGGILVMLAWVANGVYAQVFRYNHVSSSVQRQQAKWALAGLVAAVLGPFQYVLPFVILPSLAGGEVPNIFYQRVGASFFTYSFLIDQSGEMLFRFATIIFPLSFSIAILRYRLWDIDILINRTLVYGTLSALLAGIYFASVLLLENVFRSISGQQSPLAIVISTLAIAALFVPLRSRVQTFIDRRFYRDKYDAQQTLAQFAGIVRDEVDVNVLSRAILKVVEETMHPRASSLWLRK